MANGVLQGAGFVFGIIGAVFMAAAILLPYWSQTDPSDEFLVIPTHQGLWSKCVSLPTGQWQCDGYDKILLGLPTRLKVARGAAIGAIVAFFLGFCSSFFAMKCINVLEDDPSSKKRIGLIAAAFWILAGVFIGAAVSYYSYNVSNEYYQCAANHHRESFGSNHRESLNNCFVFGQSLFLGWIAMFIMIVGGLLIMCGSCSVEEEEYNNSPAYASYSRVKRTLSNSWQRVSRNDRRPPSEVHADKTYV